MQILGDQSRCADTKHLAPGFMANGCRAFLLQSGIASKRTQGSDIPAVPPATLGASASFQLGGHAALPAKLLICVASLLLGHGDRWSLPCEQQHGAKLACFDTSRPQSQHTYENIGRVFLARLVLLSDWYDFTWECAEVLHLLSFCDKK